MDDDGDDEDDNGDIRAPIIVIRTVGLQRCRWMTMVTMVTTVTMTTTNDAMSDYIDGDG